MFRSNKFILILLLPLFTAGKMSAQTPVIYDGWRVMPVRSQAEFTLGRVGGEGEQHMHGIARCYDHPDIIYLAHDVCQIWRSGDGGMTWDKCLSKGMIAHASLSVEVDPLDPDIVFATVSKSYNFRAEGYEGIYRSKNGGKTWDLVLKSKPNYNSSLHRYYRKTIAYDRTSINTSMHKALRWYAVHPYDSRTEGGPGAFYRSEDGGDTWTMLFEHTQHEKIYDLKTHPADGNTVYMATEDGLFRSSDRGASFTVPGDLPAGEIMSVEINPQNPGIIFATVKNDGVYRSANGGINFTEVRNDLTYYIFMNPGYPKLLYMVPQAKTGYNLVVSRDGGNTWTKSANFEVQPGLGREYKVVIRGEFTGIAPNPKDSTDAVAFSIAQFRKTKDAGVTFNVSSDYFTGFAWGWGNQSMIFDQFNPNRFATMNNDVGMMLTETGSDYFEDRGVPTSWREGTNPIIPWTNQNNGDIEPVKDSKKFITSAGDYFNTKVVSTLDAGMNWTVPTVVGSGITTSYIEYHLFVKYHSTNPNIIYAGNKISTDGGLTFQASAYLDNMNGSIFGMCDKYPDVIYAINRNTSRNRIYRSDNRGQSWSIYANPGYSFTPLDSRPVFNTHPTNPDRVYAVCNGIMAGITKGDMAYFDGISWRGLGVINLAGGTESGNFVNRITFDPNFPNILYVCMFSHGVENIWRSIDDGKTWMNISYNLPRIGGVGLKVNPHTGELFIGSCAGTWIFPPPYKSDNMIYSKNYTRPYYYKKPASYTGKIKDQQNNIPRDNLVIKIYNASDQQLLAEGITKTGFYFIPVPTDDPGTSEKEGTADNSSIIVKITRDGTEYQLYTDSLCTQTSLIHVSGVNKYINLWGKSNALRIKNEIPPSTELTLETFPNPFSSKTTVRYQVLNTSNVKISIFNFLGQEVKTLVNRRQQTGLFEICWDGTNNYHCEVRSGFYICRLIAGNNVYEKKLLLVRQE